MDIKENWREITVAEIAELLKNRDTGEYKKFWDTLRARSKAHFIGTEGCLKNPRIPRSMLYLFTVAAALQEKAEGRVPSIETLKKDYRLNLIVNDPNQCDFDYWFYRNLSYCTNGTTETNENIDYEPLVLLVNKNFDSSLGNLKEKENPGEMRLGDLLAALEEMIKNDSKREKEFDNTLGQEMDNLWKNWIQGELWKQIEGTFAESAVERLNDGVLQMIFTGAPGTGKTYFAKLIARYLGDLQTWLRSPRAYTLVQFHPSYDYTDFVEGLRPVQLGGRDGRMVFVKLDGAFKSFCRSVVRSGNPEALYFFLIDEINRAELSKVFGELMYCLEADKRGAENRVQTQYQHLPSYELDAGTGEPRRIPDGDDVFSDGFYIPENVRILGTMNDIDRSVESMDFALRRRFEWKAAEVDGASLKNALEKMGFPEPDLLAGRTMALNRVLVDQGGRYGLNEHYFIAQGQFANLPSKPGWGPEERLRYVWEYRVEPLLREYLRGEGDPDVTPLIESCKNAFLSSN